MSRPPSGSIGRLANANGLVAALVVATDLGRPIRQMRPFPPTLNQQWGGLQHRLCPIPRQHKQTIGILICIYLPPSNPSPLQVQLLHTRGGDSINPSVIAMCSGSVNDKSKFLIVFVGVTALKPPIYRSLLMDADIGLGPPTTYPRPNKWWDLSCGIPHLGFLVWDLLFGIFLFCVAFANIF
jgi:hypothetical protein